MNKENCTLKLVDEIIKKHITILHISYFGVFRKLYFGVIGFLCNKSINTVCIT